MDTFTWLTLGHLVGDWILQNEWMALGKRRGWFTWAGMTHFAVYTAMIGLTLWLAGCRDYILVISALSLVFVSHWLIDATDLVARWMRFYRKGNVPLVELMVDQTFHLLVLAVIAMVWAR